MFPVPIATTSNDSPSVRSNANTFSMPRVPVHAPIHERYSDILCTANIHSIRSRVSSNRPSTSNRNRDDSWNIACDCSRHSFRCICYTWDSLLYAHWYNWPFRCRQRILLAIFWWPDNRWERDSRCRIWSKMMTYMNCKLPFSVWRMYCELWSETTIYIWRNPVRLTSDPIFTYLAIRSRTKSQLWMRLHIV